METFFLKLTSILISVSVKSWQNWIWSNCEGKLLRIGIRSREVLSQNREVFSARRK